MTESLFTEYFQYVLPVTGTIKFILRDRYAFMTYAGMMLSNNISKIVNAVAFEFTPVTEDNIYVDFRIAKDLKDYRYLYSLHDPDTAPKIDVIIDNVIEITKEEYYNLLNT